MSAVITTVTQEQATPEALAPPRCQVLGWVRCCRRPAVATVLWDNGNHSDMCELHVSRLHELDWTDEEQGGGQWVTPVVAVENSYGEVQP